MYKERVEGSSSCRQHQRNCRGNQDQSKTHLENKIKVILIQDLSIFKKIENKFTHSDEYLQKKILILPDSERTKTTEKKI